MFSLHSGLYFVKIIYIQLNFNSLTIIFCYLPPILVLIVFKLTSNIGMYVITKNINKRTIYKIYRYNINDALKVSVIAAVLSKVLVAIKRGR